MTKDLRYKVLEKQVCKDGACLVCSFEADELFEGRSNFLEGHSSYLSSAFEINFLPPSFFCPSNILFSLTHFHIQFWFVSRKKNLTI